LDFSPRIGGGSAVQKALFRIGFARCQFYGFGMPPIQRSLRASLLTGASALALSVTGYSAEAQVAPTPVTQSPWTVWVQGGLFGTGGGGMNVPTLPGLTAPYTTVGPKGGWDAAAGFDYSLATDPFWHFVFDIWYGKSRTASASTQSQSSTHTTVTSHPSYFKTFFSSTTTSTSSSQTDWEREHHLALDFMAGRDFALGQSAGEIQFGIRVADLAATAWAQQSGSSTSTFFSSSSYSLITDPTASSSETAFGTWHSRFFGVGPRLAATGTVPLQAAWSVDYEAGIAGLFGNRSFDYAVTVTPGNLYFAGSNNSNVLIFNTDGWAGLSYALSPHLKVTGGVHADYYADALTTYTLAGGLTNVDRLFWGPFLRLTGNF
jgi:hypothetical protein